MPLARANPSAAGTPDSGTPMTRSASTGAWVGQQLAHAAAGLVDLAPVELGVGAGDVGELEDAQPRLHLLEPRDRQAAHAVAVDDDQLAGLDLAHEGGADDAEGRRLRGQHPALRRLGRAQPAQAQRPEAVGVAHAEQLLRVHQHEREGALDDGQHGLQRAGQLPGLGEGLAKQLGHHVAVGGDRARAACRPSRPAPWCWSGCRCGRGRSRPGRRAGRPAARRPSPRRRGSSSGCGRWPGAPAGPRACARRRRWPPGPCP